MSKAKDGEADDLDFIFDWIWDQLKDPSLGQFMKNLPAGHQH